MKKTIISKTAVLLAAVVLVQLLSACGAGAGGSVADTETAAQAQTATTAAVSEPDENAVPASEPAPEPTPDPYVGCLRISEVMANNSSALLGPDGAFHDWIELRCESEEAVSLNGWSFMKNGKLCPIVSERALGKGEYVLIYCDKDGVAGGDSAGFSFGAGDEIALVTPGGTVSERYEIPAKEKNISYVPGDEGILAECRFPTPGLENTMSAYDRLNSSAEVKGPLIINEIMGSNRSCIKSNIGYDDWVELKNISDSPVELSDYFLSDDSGNLKKTQLLEATLQPGQTILIWCSGNSGNSDNYNKHADFAIDASSDAVIISDANGKIIDYAAYRDIRDDESLGRMPGESGWFVFTKPSPNRENTGGVRRYSTAPVSYTRDGVYEDVASVSVELGAAGTIYYTLDGSKPTDRSATYSGPIDISKTTVIRAVAYEPGMALSDEMVLTFVVNEGFTLPVLSLVATEREMTGIYWNGKKDVKQPATLSYYDENGSFTRECAVYMKGHTSLELPKKSFGVDFTGIYGSGKLEYDIFGGGITSFEKLSIRAGQDYTFAVIRNELLQELAFDCTDSLLNQRSQYCILLFNGEYWGIYCLKDDISKAYYADWAGVSKDAVIDSKNSSAVYYAELLDFCKNHDLSKDEDYAEFCERLDIESLIDWVIIQGFSANTDNHNNVRLYRTDTGKWQLALYDLDWALTSDVNAASPFANVLTDDRGSVTPVIVRSLLKNEKFREQLCRRAAELLSGPLSNEAVIEKIDTLTAIIEPEIVRERQKWDGLTESWYRQLERLKGYILNNDWDIKCMNAVLRITKAPDELRQELLAYFD